MRRSTPARPADAAAAPARGAVALAGALLRLVRWPNAVIAASGVAAAAWWVAPEIARHDHAWLWAAAAAVALTAVANAYNDYRDVDIDRVAHPARPLPSGAITPAAALRVTAAAAATGVAAAWIARPVLGSLSLVVVLLMLAYSRWLARLGVAGNLVTSALASLPFLYGAWSVGRPLAALPLLAVAMPLHLARELAKDADDVAGDRGARRTVAVARGADAARRVALAVLAAFWLLLAVVSARLPGFWLPQLPAILCTLLAALRLARGRAGAPAALKAAMAAALAALLLAPRPA